MKFDLKKLNILYWPETQDIWDIVEVKKQENEDSLELKTDYDKFLTDFDTKMKFDQKMNIQSKIEKTLTNINNNMEWLMDFWLTDRWEIDIDEGQDTQYLKEIAWEINNVTKEYINWQEQAKNSLNNNMDKFINKLSNIEKKATSAENLKWFLNKLEDKKKDNTLHKIASFIPWSESVKAKNSYTELTKAEKNAWRVKF